jgi:hypothetical protein
MSQTCLKRRTPSAAGAVGDGRDVRGEIEGGGIEGGVRGVRGGIEGGGTRVRCRLAGSGAAAPAAPPRGIGGVVGIVGIVGRLNDS